VSARIRLGSWRCPSGNSCDVFHRSGPGVGHLDFEWDSPPPLTPADHVYYVLVIRPAVLRLAQEYLERPGRVIVATLAMREVPE
jgi:hypothetical protein